PLLDYLSIICAACCARLTSQNGSSVPIANVPMTARPSPAHVVQVMWGAINRGDAINRPPTDSSVATGGFVLAWFTAVAFTATAVAAPLGEALLNFVEVRLPGMGAGVAGTVAAGVAGAVSLSMNMAAMTRK